MNLEQWPNCITPDCENKRCCWSETPYCFSCAERLIGHAELIRRFNSTHTMTWEEALSADAADWRGVE